MSVSVARSLALAEQVPKPERATAIANAIEMRCIIISICANEHKHEHKHEHEHELEHESKWNPFKAALPYPKRRFGSVDTVTHMNDDKSYLPLDWAGESVFELMHFKCLVFSLLVQRAM